MWRLPFPDKCLTDGFGETAGRDTPHRGTDWGKGTAGKGVIAVNDGVIVENTWNNVLGWVIVLKVGGWFIGYCHLDAQSMLKVGTLVKSGQRIGTVGNTGSASRGAHLHATLGKTKDSYKIGKVYDLHKYLKTQIAKQDAKKDMTK